MGVASGCGEQEVGVASGSGWKLWVWLLGVVLRRYIDFLILLIPTPLVSVLFGSIYNTLCLECRYRCSGTFYPLKFLSGGIVYSNPPDRISRILSGRRIFYPRGG